MRTFDVWQTKRELFSRNLPQKSGNIRVRQEQHVGTRPIIAACSFNFSCGFLKKFCKHVQYWPLQRSGPHFSSFFPHSKILFSGLPHRAQPTRGRSKVHLILFQWLRQQPRRRGGAHGSDSYPQFIHSLLGETRELQCQDTGALCQGRETDPRVIDWIQLGHQFFCIDRVSGLVGVRHRSGRERHSGS